MVGWCPEGRYLAERPSFAQDPLIFGGAYYVQEASSMLIAHAIRTAADTDQPLRVLDLCAAPGGKTTLLSSLIGPNSLLVSNELVGKRFVALEENVTRWGCPNVVLTSLKAEDLKGWQGYFDVVLTDAPCSGEGMFRKDPDTIREWSERLPAACSRTQQEILTHAAALVREGGLLLFSTCTYAPAENEHNLQWLAQTGQFEAVRLPVLPAWGLQETAVKGNAGEDFFGYRCWPHRVRGEGFYLAVLRKTTSQRAQRRQSGKKAAELIPKRFHGELLPWLDGTDWDFLLRDEVAYAVRRQWVNEVKNMTADLAVRVPGIELGRYKNNKLIPSHALALSQALSPDIAPLDLDYVQAVSFLRKQEVPITVPEGTQGWLRMRYQGCTLGWAKASSGRLNNHYPIEWRLRKQF